MSTHVIVDTSIQVRLPDFKVTLLDAYRTTITGAVGSLWIGLNCAHR